MRTITTWLWLALVAGLLLGLGYYRDALHREQVAHARDNAAADKRQADALAGEIKRHNEQADGLRKVATDATERAQAAERSASAATDALRRSEQAVAAGAAAQRRLRDANATGLVIARAQIEQAGAAAQCAPALEAARVRAGLLDELDADAGRVERSAIKVAAHARASSADADGAHVAGAGCVRGYEVTR